MRRLQALTPHRLGTCLAASELAIDRVDGRAEARLRLQRRAQHAGAGGAGVGVEGEDNDPRLGRHRVIGQLAVKVCRSQYASCAGRGCRITVREGVRHHHGKAHDEEAPPRDGVSTGAVSSLRRAPVQSAPPPAGAPPCNPWRTPYPNASLQVPP